MPQSKAGEHYSYVLVRQDIPLADQLVQVGHACLAAGNAYDLPEPCNLVVLAVPDRESLVQGVGYTEMRGVRWQVFDEPDDDMGFTAACSAPIADQATRRLFRRYKLWQ